MARGRFISNSIIMDRQIHELSSDTCRLAYTWLITLADREGRVSGEPDLLLAQLFPRRRDITPEMIEGFINEWVLAGFMIWYEGKDKDRVLQLVNFEKHQSGMHKDREAKSAFDDPDDCRIIAGVSPEQIPFKLKNKFNDKDKGNDKLMPKQVPNTDLFDACVDIYKAKKNMLVADPQAFSEMIAEFKDNGVTPQDYSDAIDAMDADPDYTGHKPTSYKNWAINNAKRRLNPRKPKPRANDPKSIADHDEMVKNKLVEELTNV